VIALAKPRWEPAVFSRSVREAASSGAAAAAGRSQARRQEALFEWKTFRAFARVSGLDIDPRSIEMCDPNAASPPFPDVRCRVSGQFEYFELGEVTEEDLARKHASLRRI